MRIAITNGRTPLNIVLMGTSVIEDKTKTFIPTGGVINPISMSKTTITPNQMGSNPIDFTIGIIKGTVITIAELISKNIPRII